MFEKIWVLIALIIIFLVLSIDPKNPTSSIGNSQFNALFSSTSDSQKFVRNFTWALIFVFALLTLLINYSN